jgi:hypothetical protein
VAHSYWSSCLALDGLPCGRSVVVVPHPRERESREAERERRGRASRAEAAVRRRRRHRAPAAALSFVWRRSAEERRRGSGRAGERAERDGGKAAAVRGSSRRRRGSLDEHLGGSGIAHHRADAAPAVPVPACTTWRGDARIAPERRRRCRCGFLCSLSSFSSSLRRRGLATGRLLVAGLAPLDDGGAYGGEQRVEARRWRLGGGGGGRADPGGGQPAVPPSLSTTVAVTPGLGRASVPPCRRVARCPVAPVRPAPRGEGAPGRGSSASAAMAAALVLWVDLKKYKGVFTKCIKRANYFGLRVDFRQI